MYARTDGAFTWFRRGVHSDTQYDPGPGGQVMMSLAADGTTGSGTPHTGIVRAAQFAVTSDRDAKQDFASVDAAAVLAAVVATPVTTWSYRSEPEVRHIGMVGQDFYTAFRVGAGATSISTVDADGVALAAIQGLDAKLEAGRVARDAEIAALRAELAALRAALAAIVGTQSVATAR